MNDEQNDDPIATLIRLAGPRTRVSDARTARIREAVHDEWMRTTQRRDHMRFFAIAATIVIAILGGYLTLRPKPVTPVERLVATTDHATSLDWRGVTLRLDKATRIRFVSDDAIALDRGAIYFDGNGAHREVRTTFGTIRDIGTQYEARLDDALHIRVREGRVDFRGNVIDAGNELVATKSGAIARNTIARSGDAWAWIEEAAPPMRLEGMTLRDALTRIAREKGLELDDVPNGDKRLHGDIALTPSEALDAATAAAGVSYRIHGEQLVIERK